MFKNVKIILIVLSNSRQQNKPLSFISISFPYVFPISKDIGFKITTKINILEHTQSVRIGVGAKSKFETTKCSL